MRVSRGKYHRPATCTETDFFDFYLFFFLLIYIYISVPFFLICRFSSPVIVEDRARYTRENNDRLLKPKKQNKKACRGTDKMLTATTKPARSFTGDGNTVHCMLSRCVYHLCLLSC